MNRREILKLTAIISGSAVSGSLASAFLSGCETSPNDAEDISWSFFDSESEVFARQLADTILPETDSPSASAVGAHIMMDNMVGNVFSPEDRKEYEAGFTRLREYLTNLGFMEKDASTRENILLETSNHADEQIRDAYASFRQQILLYYLSTEVVAKEFLNYLPIPGGYEGCISVSEVGNKAWAI